MRKQFLSMMAIAGITLLASCSNDEIVPAIDNGSNGVESEITLALNAGGDGVTTRAGRPVNSSAAASNVNKVQLKLLKKDGTNKWGEANNGEAFKDIPNGTIDWTSLSTEGVPGYDATNRDTKKTIKVTGLGASSTYKLIAYGYEEKHGYTIATFDDTNNGRYKTTDITAGDNGVNVEEFFSGAVEFETDANSKITTANVSVTMKREVAGLLGYFHNIPIKKANADGELQTVKYVYVKTVAECPSFQFPYREETGVDLCGLSQNTASTTLLKYDLSSIIDGTTGTGGKSYQDQVNEYSDENNIFKINAINTADVKTKENSIINGRFIIPFQNAVNSNTLQVVLADDSETPIKTWNIKISSQNNAQSYTGNALQYNILRNKFYSIGKKLRSDEIAPDPSNPDVDPDEPIDLSQDNDIILILNDAWDVIYNMGLED